jgi:hypothetical protein
MGTLRKADKDLMKRYGFLALEIKQLDNARTPDGKYQHVNLNTESWKSTLKSRKKYIHDMRQAKLTDRQIVNLILDYYKKKERSIFDFLQVEGSPTQRRINKEADVLKRFHAKKKVARQFGRRYGKPIYPRKFPKSIKELPIIPSTS